MDILESHRLGLIEQLDVESVALAGRPRDAAQRAVVCHHVADMLGLAHAYALLAARGALAIDPAVRSMERQARRAYWRLKRAERAALGERIAVFAETVRALDAERCAALLMAYRLVATPSLSGEAAGRLSPDMFAALLSAQSARGQADAGTRRNLFAAHQRWAEALIGERLDAAIAALGWPLDPFALNTAVEALRIPLKAFERAERRGLARVEALLRKEKALPEPFAANPAQAFFQLQRLIAERRRRAAEGDDLSADEAVRLAA